MNNIRQIFSNINFWLCLWCVLFLLSCLRFFFIFLYHVPIDYNEGWNAQLSDWMLGHGGHVLYSSSLGFIFNNYPPLSFLLSGALAWLGCDAVIAGRIVSFASVLVCAVSIAGVIWTVSGKKSAAWATAFFFLLTANTAFYLYCGLDDPQWLAQALMLAGFFLLIRKDGPALTTGRLWLSACLIVLGGFTKHNLMALPLAVFIWLMLVNKRKALLWGVMVAGGVGIGFLACYEAFGAAFFHDVFLHQRVIRWGRATHALRVLPLIGGSLFVGGALLYKQRYEISRNDPAVVIALFSLLALVFGVLESVGEGVDYNCMFDLFIAGTLLCGVGLARLPARGGAGIGRACLIMSLPLVVLIPLRSVTFYKEVHYIHHINRAWQNNIAILKEHKASLLCTDMALCYWAGSADAVDLFNLSEAIKKHRTDFPLQTMLAQHHFAVVQVSGSASQYSSGDSVLDGWLATAGYRPFLSGEDHMLLLAPPSEKELLK